GSLARERRIDQRPIDPPLEQGSPDPLGSPLLEGALVLGKQARVARVVQVPLLAEQLDRAVHRGGITAELLQMAPHLGDRPVAPAQVTMGGVERALKIVFEIERYAARPPTASTALSGGSSRGSSRGSIGLTR